MFNFLICWDNVMLLFWLDFSTKKTLGWGWVKICSVATSMARNCSDFLLKIPDFHVDVLSKMSNGLALTDVETPSLTWLSCQNHTLLFQKRKSSHKHIIWTTMMIRQTSWIRSVQIKRAYVLQHYTFYSSDCCGASHSCYLFSTIYSQLLFSLLINILNSRVLSIEKQLSLPLNEAHIKLLQQVPARII